ncbi:MAG: cation transporter [Methanosarcinales archaeon]|nr:cation transporter [Methanosarcinales archaeon]
MQPGENKLQQAGEAVNKKKSRAALLSVASNSVLVLLKLAVGLGIGSVSVISEAIHSGVDLLAAVIAFIAVRKSGKPADRHHPFGHGKVENISGSVEAMLIFLAAAWIILEALRKLMNPEPLEAAGWGVMVMLLSASANIFVSRRLFQVGKETDSLALQADAWHLRTDVYTSAGVMAGLLIIIAGRLLVPGVNLSWVDPVAAMVVAALIIKAAYELTVQSARDLLDVCLPPEDERAIRRCIQSFGPAVRGYHHLRTRKSGPYRFVEFHLLVDATMTVDEAHRIAEVMADAIRGRCPGTTATIHIEPCNGACPSSPPENSHAG